MRYKLSIRVTVFLIILTILFIAAFQGYWLYKNYQEEKKLFSTRTNIIFRETVFRLQASKFKLDSTVSVRIQNGTGAMGVANVLRNVIEDSLPAAHTTRQTMYISVNTSTSTPIESAALDKDSGNIHFAAAKHIAAGRVFGFLSDMDSLQQPITLKDVATRYKQALDKEKINVAFAVDTIPTLLKGVWQAFPDDLNSNIVTIGFTRPVSYRLLFNNNTWYLLKRISQPIWISFFLMAITILSFLMVYRNMKQQQKLAQLKNDFISNITHELKTPIATVSVAIEALRNFDALEDRKTANEYLDISANEISRLSLLVDKVLKLTMFENREIALNKEKFNLTDLARDIIGSMKLQFEKHRASVELSRTGHRFDIVADKLHIASVLYNLLDNALKYSRQNPQILVQLIDHKQYIELRVTDNGIGIAKEYRQRVFEKFFRVPNGNRHNTKGYGLGLSYVAHIVQRHMGFIEVESEVGKGSTFSIKLPFEEAPVIDYDGRKVIRKMKIG
ncbi:HAMP domain-containing sensor histidine kinase [Chitinophaga sp. 212800010-3]|uniref:sensor histidine kinase n=1 Tax=unclassified Chitinophaga TaxID=2619133 RepID=UPI002DEDB76F|nr:Histidine kinase domain-containing protein [Chitinophaga sp. 212800010-3]